MAPETAKLKMEVWVCDCWKAHQKMQTVRMAFMDALILSSVDHTPGVEFFVTWNAKHFKGKTTLTVLTPEEYLAL